MVGFEEWPIEVATVEFINDHSEHELIFIPQVMQLQCRSCSKYYQLGEVV